MSELPEIQVFTFKDGLLARLAHDLRLTLTGFEVRVTGSEIEARMWPESLRVDGVMRKGKLRADDLSASDKAKILSNLREDVMVTNRHPEVRFRGTFRPSGGGGTVDGQLEMLGKVQPVQIKLQVQGNRLAGTVELRPSRWGIRPYKALAGAIKLQDFVRIELSVPVFDGDQTWQAGAAAAG